MKKQHKLVLVNPVNTCRSGFSVNSSSRFPPLGLGIIASLTPDAWDVELVDENFSPFNYRDADLVGITAFTSSANRAYQIAAAYQRHGIPVVMGGIHASMCFAEAQQFVDAVVIGEAESVWPQVLADVLHGELKPTYRGHWLDLAGLQPPRRDIYDSHYRVASIQTSRGCPLDCDFCSVTAYNGRRYRRRPTNEVLDEIESIPHDLLFFVDDNVIGYGADSRQQAMQLFQGMVERDLRKRWICQASVNIADDAEVLDWAGRAGCRMVFLGLEAEDIDSLTEVNKRLNMKRGTSSYEQTFDRIHQAGIAVLGAFIFGMDGDTPDKLRDRTDFMLGSGVNVMQVTVMTPLPGTQLYRRLQQEGRLLYTNFPEDWSHYDLAELVHRPKHVGRAELWEVIRECAQRIYDPPTLKAKAKQTRYATGSWEATEFAYRANVDYRNVVRANGIIH